MIYKYRTCISVFSCILTLLVYFFLPPVVIFAHSGRTDSSGGHNCNVGACAGTYHYHNGGPAYTPPTRNTYSYPTSTPKPRVTNKPLPTNTVEPRRIVTSTPTIQSSARVLGESSSNEGGNAGSMLVIGSVLSYLIYKFYKAN